MLHVHAPVVLVLCLYSASTALAPSYCTSAALGWYAYPASTYNNREGPVLDQCNDNSAPSSIQLPAGGTDFGTKLRTLARLRAAPGRLPDRPPLESRGADPPAAAQVKHQGYSTMWGQTFSSTQRPAESSEPSPLRRASRARRPKAEGPSGAIARPSHKFESRGVCDCSTRKGH